VASLLSKRRISAWLEIWELLWQDELEAGL